MNTGRPNILFLFSDQHRGSALSCAGDPNVRTPHLDRLADNGIRFTNAYANSPMCAPFRASLYTGQYISSHGVNSLFKPLLPRQPVLPEVLQQHGYHTSHMGKWHLSGGDCPSHFVSPYFRPGWDEWMGWENSNRPFRTEYSTGDMPMPIRTMDGYQTDVLADMTIEWIRSYSGDKPWFHVVSIEPPHPPYEAPAPYMDRFAEAEIEFRPNVDPEDPGIDRYRENLRGYYAQIENLDDNIGRIRAALEACGQLENTLIFYFSDHGDMMGSHGRLHKEVPEEESSNIPLIVRYPDRIPAGTVCNGLFSGVDLMPSLLGLLGIPVPESVEGQNLSATLRGEQLDGAESVLFQFDRPFFSFKEHHDLHYRGIRHGEWKYVVHYRPEQSRLYHLEEDPYELDNRWDDPACAPTKAQLHARLADILTEIGDDFLEQAHRV